MIQAIRKFSLALGTFALASIAFCADVIKSNYYLFDKAVGSNTWTRDGDKVVSDTKLDLPGTKIDSHLTVDFQGDAIVSYEITEKVGAATGHVIWKNKELKIESNGKVVATKSGVNYDKSALFSTFHPQLLSTLWPLIKGASTKVATKLTVIGQLEPMNVSATISRKSSLIDGASRRIRVANVGLGGVDVLCAFDEESGGMVGYLVPTQKFKVAREGADSVFEDPATKFKELSQPTLKTDVLEDVKSAMSDGTLLACSVVKPEGSGRFPVVLIRTPYGRKASALEGSWWASRGYVLVAQDVRGRGDSGGEWDPFNREVGDGYDTLDWLVKQPWCDGNVGMIGGSYLGYVQWCAAVTKHPALKCIIPQVSPPDPTRNIPMENGAFMLYGSIWWARIVKDKDANLGSMGQKLNSPKGLLSVPLTNVDNVALGADIPFYDQWLKRTTIEDWPGAFRQEQIGGVKIPVLHISGTWDGDGVGTKLNWEALRAAKGNQWVIFGPWTHAFNMATKVGGLDYGPQSLLELDSTYLRFFDTYLKGKQVGMQDVPRAKVFITGANYWEEAKDFPFPGYKLERLYLGSGRANSSASTAMLTPTPGSGKDRYSYNPFSKTINKSVDTASIDSLELAADALNDESLIYRTAPFQQPRIITGPVEVTLKFSTTARDATVHALICDEAPDGKIMPIGSPGTQRVSFLDRTLKPLVPNRIYTVNVRPWWFAHQFDIGHKMVLLIRSDMFPQFARNPGTGKWEGTTRRYVSAMHTIHKSASNPSTITYYASP